MIGLKIFSKLTRVSDALPSYTSNPFYFGYSLGPVKHKKFENPPVHDSCDIVIIILTNWRLSY